MALDVRKAMESWRAVRRASVSGREAESALRAGATMLAAMLEAEEGAGRSVGGSFVRALGVACAEGKWATYEERVAGGGPGPWIEWVVWRARQLELAVGESR